MSRQIGRARAGHELGARETAGDVPRGAPTSPATAASASPTSSRKILQPANSIPLPSTATTPRARTLRIALWLIQALLAAVFLLVGYTHALAPIAVAIARAPWVASLPVPLVRFIGVAEVAGAIGVILPAATRIRPRLAALAATGLAALMGLAIPFHLLRGELKEIVVNLVLGALAAFVAWARARRAPIDARA